MEIIHVVQPGMTDRDRGRGYLESAAAAFDEIEVETRLVEHGDVVAGIVEASADHDVTVVGATREGLLQQFVFGAIPEQVGARAEGTVIMAKRHLGIASRLTRWIRQST